VDLFIRFEAESKDKLQRQASMKEKARERLKAQEGNPRASISMSQSAAGDIKAVLEVTRPSSFSSTTAPGNLSSNNRSNANGSVRVNNDAEASKSMTVNVAQQRS
jgi:hypothetical protein